MKTAAIIQARMGSTRLPGKVLMPLAGIPVIRQVFDRVSRITGLDAVAVATTAAAEDDELVDYCRRGEIPVHRGSASDVLDRYVKTARALGAGAVVRITADCPFLDPRESGRVLEAFLAAGGVDYVCNIDPPRLPDGLDTEVVRLDALERAWREASDTESREHVTLYIRRHPDRFRHLRLEEPRDLTRFRLTLDYPEDYRCLSALADKLAEEGRFGNLDEIVSVLEEHPEIAEMNAHLNPARRQA